MRQSTVKKPSSLEVTSRGVDFSWLTELNVTAVSWLQAVAQKCKHTLRLHLQTNTRLRGSLLRSYDDTVRNLSLLLLNIQFLPQATTQELSLAMTFTLAQLRQLGKVQCLYFFISS